LGAAEPLSRKNKNEIAAPSGVFSLPRKLASKDISAEYYSTRGSNKKALAGRGPKLKLHVAILARQQRRAVQRSSFSMQRYPARPRTRPGLRPASHEGFPAIRAGPAKSVRGGGLWSAIQLAGLESKLGSGRGALALATQSFDLARIWIRKAMAPGGVTGVIMALVFIAGTDALLLFMYYVHELPPVAAVSADLPPR
jgi:hypothetical protein